MEFEVYEEEQPVVFQAEVTLNNGERVALLMSDNFLTISDQTVPYAAIRHVRLNGKELAIELEDKRRTQLEITNASKAKQVLLIILSYQARGKSFVKKLIEGFNGASGLRSIGGFLVWAIPIGTALFDMSNLSWALPVVMAVMFAGDKILSDLEWYVASQTAKKYILES